jgi:hypothetical protein
MRFGSNISSCYAWRGLRSKAVVNVITLWLGNTCYCSSVRYRSIICNPNNGPPNLRFFVSTIGMPDRMLELKVSGRLFAYENPYLSTNTGLHPSTEEYCHMKSFMVTPLFQLLLLSNTDSGLYELPDINQYNVSFFSSEIEPTVKASSPIALLEISTPRNIS